MAEATKPRKQSRAEPLTVAEYAAAYHRRPIEVANGEIIEMSPPNLRRANIAHYLYDLLRPWVEERRLARVSIEVPYVLDASDRKDWVKGARVHAPGDPDSHTLSERETLPGDPVLAGWSASIAALLDGPPQSEG